MAFHRGKLAAQLCTREAVLRCESVDAVVVGRRMLSEAELARWISAAVGAGGDVHEGVSYRCPSPSGGPISGVSRASAAFRRPFVSIRIHGSN